MQDQNSKQALVAYVPFKTFLNALDMLAQHGLPAQIDRSVWSSLSGASISQLLIAFRFLGLTSDDGKVTPELDKLVHDKPNRKTLLRRTLERSYPQLSKEVVNMTPAAFSSAMGKTYKAEGETQKKAKSFFLQAARYAELPLSNFLMGKTRRVSSRKRRSTQSPSDPTNAGQFTPPPSGSTKSINLRGGGTLTLNVTADVWNMPPEDRAFVLELVDKIQGYEKGSAGGSKAERKVASL